MGDEDLKLAAQFLARRHCLPEEAVPVIMVGLSYAARATVLQFAGWELRRRHREADRRDAAYAAAVAAEQG
jgi:hypothetical protein